MLLLKRKSFLKLQNGFVTNLQCINRLFLNWRRIQSEVKNRWLAIDEKFKSIGSGRDYTYINVDCYICISWYIWSNQWNWYYHKFLSIFPDLQTIQSGTAHLNHWLLTDVAARPKSQTHALLIELLSRLFLLNCCCWQWYRLYI